MLARLATHLELERTTGKLGLAGYLLVDCFAAGKLSVNSLERFKQHSHFFQRASVVLHALGTAWIPFSADLALLTRADVLGTTMGLPEPVGQRSQLLDRLPFDLRGPGDTHHLFLRDIQKPIIRF